jgi:hypothetical protein
MDVTRKKNMVIFKDNIFSKEIKNKSNINRKFTSKDTKDFDNSLSEDHENLIKQIAEKKLIKECKNSSFYDFNKTKFQNTNYFNFNVNNGFNKFVKKPLSKSLNFNNISNDKYMTEPNQIIKNPNFLINHYNSIKEKDNNDKIYDDILTQSEKNSISSFIKSNKFKINNKLINGLKAKTTNMPIFYDLKMSTSVKPKTITYRLQDYPNVFRKTSENYNSPYASLANIKMNNYLVNEINSMYNDILLENTIKQYKKELETNVKISMMPLVKEIKLTANRNKIEEEDKEMDSVLQKNETSQIQFSIKKKNILNTQSILVISNSKCYQQRPSSRIYASGVLWRDFYIMFGGIQDKRKNDIWFLNLDLDCNSNEIYTKEEIKEFKNKLSSITINDKDDTKSKKIIDLNYVPDHYKDYYSQLLDSSLFFHNMRVQMQNSYDNGKAQYRWFKYEIPESIKNPIYPRYGHTTLEYNNKIYIYGGNFEKTGINDLLIFDILNLSFSSPEKMFNYREVSKRYFHTAVKIKNYMLIQGGRSLQEQNYLNLEISEKENFLSDIFLFNFQTNTWEKVNYSGEQFNKVSNHSSVVAIPENKLISKFFSFYKHNNDTNSHNKYISTKIKNEGIYFFGGLEEDGNCSSTLRVLKIFKNPCELSTVASIGRFPRPRFNCTMTLVSHINCILIYGGRNMEGLHFSDIFFFNLENLNWIGIKNINNNDNIKLNRACHIAFDYNENIIILGGQNEKGFESFSPNILYLNDF